MLQIQKLKKYKLKFASFYQWLLNLITFHRLKVNNVYMTDPIVINNNNVDIVWNVKGAYKIQILGYADVPGNIQGVRFVFHPEFNPIKIIFYGVFSKVEKEIDVENYSVEIAKQPEINIKLMEPGVKLPVLNGCMPSIHHYHTNIVTPHGVKFNNVNINLKKIFCKFDLFNASNYNRKTMSK